ncbi:hypothetical protein GL213_11005 [Halogeometricum borinquense]|uniref:Uncharacterized protein n=1 Tax=Halogeometricum borinquense TaxID=60847 RepID=A0A6C0UGF2_9EURY|nr:DUF5793 family protein [Halogeometricum borinquense]QIB73643.1 hypothetical protein G3I44_04685 [Halogeometricum borinquense]QIQ77001.1 hypothetical protein GL213_11005 [Halogeometricum borinquense]
MRRDYFELDVKHIDWVEEGGDPEKPLVRIDFHGPEGSLMDRLTDADGEHLDAAETDVAFRLQGDVNDPDATGVVSVTNRITGDFVLELNEDADDVLRFIRAAREYGKSEADVEDGQYRVEIRTDDDNDTVVYEKRTFLVYDADGNLLRGHSLIPSGVEL